VNAEYWTTMILNNFAVIEGCDGSGTTTQLMLLTKRFEAAANARCSGTDKQKARCCTLPPFYATSEPTKTEVGLLVRRILEGAAAVQKETLARLFAADRGEHLYGPEGIAERCERGTLVVSDRYTPSSLVYQGLECGRELPETLNAAFPLPELLVYLDVDTETAMGRIGGRDRKREIYERLDFQARVREAYLELLPVYEKAGVRVVRQDGLVPPEEAAQGIWRALEKMPIMERAKA